MNPCNNTDESLKSLNGLLKNKFITGYVRYFEEYSDPRFRGYWYFNPASHGFLGKTHEEAYNALNVIIESIRCIQESQHKNKDSLLTKIKNILGGKNQQAN